MWPDLKSAPVRTLLTVCATDKEVVDYVHEDEIYLEKPAGSGALFSHSKNDTEKGYVLECPTF